MSMPSLSPNSVPLFDNLPAPHNDAGATAMAPLYRSSKQHQQTPPAARSAAQLREVRHG